MGVICTGVTAETMVANEIGSHCREKREKARGLNVNDCPPQRAGMKTGALWNWSSYQVRKRSRRSMECLKQKQGYLIAREWSVSKTAGWWRRMWAEKFIGFGDKEVPGDLRGI